MGETVTQLEHGLLTVHVQPPPVVTDTLVLPLPPGADQVDGDIVKLPASPAWVTLKLCPAMVTEQLRNEQLVFAVVLTVTIPLPVPLVGDTVNQLEHGFDTDQLQPPTVVTVTLVLLIPAGAFQLVTLRL